MGLHMWLKPINAAQHGALAKLFVGQLPKTHTPEQIRALFAECLDASQIESVRLVGDKATGAPTGAAFVTVCGKEAADAAIMALHGQRTIAPGLRPLQVCAPPPQFWHRVSGSLSSVPPVVLEVEVGVEAGVGGGNGGGAPCAVRKVPPPLYKLRPCPSYSRCRDRNNLVCNYLRNVVRPHKTWVCRHICQLQHMWPAHVCVGSCMCYAQATPLSKLQ